MSVNLSRAQLLNFIQCPRRFWLDQYHPELEGDVSMMDACLDAEEAADAAARSLLDADGIVKINGRLGLRKAIEHTADGLRDGVTVLDATFEFEGISVQVDVLDWSQPPYRAISVTAAAAAEDRHIDDCALQAWAMRGLELPEHRFFLAMPHAEKSVAGKHPPGDALRTSSALESDFSLVDVSESVASRIDRLDAVVSAARALHASLEEPQAQTGPQCRAGYPCPFLDYCVQQ